MLDQFAINSSDPSVPIEFHDSSIATTHLTIGPRVQEMTDEQILLAYNQTIAAQIRFRDESGEYVAVEVPAGRPQVEHQPGTINGWSPRGDVLRCFIEDGGGDDSYLPVIFIDDREFTWDEFGRMLCTHAGWGMRIVFVPDDELEAMPKIAVQEPDAENSGDTIPISVVWVISPPILSHLAKIGIVSPEFMQEGAQVVFAPASGGGAAASGVTDASGRYHLTTLDPGDGALPGTYHVMISKTEAEGGSAASEAVKPGMSEEEATEAAMEAYEASGGADPEFADKLPAKYKDPSTSGFKVEVTKGGQNEFNFELESESGSGSQPETKPETE